LRAIAIRDINLLNTSLVSQRRVYELMIQSRDIELRRFYNLTLQANNNNSINPWPIVLSGLGGLVLGGGIMSGILLLNGH
jgi:adenylate cyclase